MKPIVADSRASAWLAAVEHLRTCDDWEDYNVILEIREPMRRSVEDKRIEERVDQFLRAAEHSPLNTVAETIFPGGEYRRHGPKGVYEIYPDEIFPTIKRLPELSWGTYAYRLVRREGPDGPVNPLQYCVEKIKKQLAGKSIKTACYELSLSDLAVDLPLYDATKDRKREIGGPCLSHVSVKVTRDKQILMTALYRSHYYVQKALGNLLGLARLQAFICEETQVPPGALVCMSTYATLERDSGSWSTKKLEELFDGLATPDREGAAAASAP
jgi:hypothetical protein